MIPVDKGSKPKPRTLESKACKASLHEIWNGGTPNKDAIAYEYYGAADVKAALAELYHNKCAYCESYDNEFEVEHYRPKKGITGIPRKEHPGYYWLCYEWTNLLPACHDCNKQGSKGNRFPIDGDRVYSPSLTPFSRSIDLNENNFLSTPLRNEAPLLLHPERSGFNPFSYFSFDKNGWMGAVQKEGTLPYAQAVTTITICKLNRDKLFLIVRKPIIEDLKKELKLKLVQYLDNEITIKGFRRDFFFRLQKIKENADRRKPHSFFWNYLYENIEYYIGVFFEYRNDIQSFLIKLTKEFKEG